MSNTIKIKKSNSAGATPNTLEYGELAINYEDGKLYYKDSSNNIKNITETKVLLSDTKPANPVNGNIWFESDTGKTFVYYDGFWVEIGGEIGPTIPAGGSTGQVLAKLSGTNYDDAWRDPYIKNSSSRLLLDFYPNNINGSGYRMYGYDYSNAGAPALTGTKSTFSLSVRANITDVTWYRVFWSRRNWGAWYAFAGVSPRFYWVDGSGVQRDTNYMGSALSTTAGMRWYRLRIDASGADTTVVFETAPDSATEPSSWTTHSTYTAVGITGLSFTGSVACQIGGWADTYAPIATFSRVIEKHDGTVVLDADFAAQPSDCLAFTESSASAQTVSLSVSRYSFGIPTERMIGSGNVTLNANFVYYSPMLITEAVSIDMVHMECTTTPAATRNVRYGIYASDQNLQPTGPPLMDTGSISVASLGSYYKQLSSPVTLQPGLYLVAYNRDGQINTRIYRTASPGAFAGGGGSTMILRLYGNQTYGAFPSTPTTWTSVNTTSVGLEHNCRFRWTPA